PFKNFGEGHYQYILCFHFVFNVSAAKGVHFTGEKGVEGMLCVPVLPFAAIYPIFFFRPVNL
ncbi:MAG: hypothetical protein IM606_13365, partial [Cytophagales bacterium]|nr:hypothetical protein [Cytophagales bacterium]